MSTSEYRWDTQFAQLFKACCEKYHNGDENFEGYYSSADLAFLQSIGYKTREFFDFVEDHVDGGGDPSLETALLIASVRKDHFQVIMEGQSSDHVVVPADLPAKDSELEGIQWLPRIIVKASAKLRGELDPDIMYGCGGDRAFLSGHGIHPSEFLRAVWAAKGSEEKILSFVRTRSILF